MPLFNAAFRYWCSPSIRYPANLIYRDGSTSTQVGIAELPSRSKRLDTVSMSLQLTILLLIGTIATAIYTICLWGGLALLRRHSLQRALASAEGARNSEMDAAHGLKPRTEWQERTNISAAAPNSRENQLVWGD